jgi:uncharacterized repeat protein (TIGR03803 family)
LVLDTTGNFYGTTSTGGTNNSGVVFKLDPTGNETVLYNFTGAADGGQPYGSLFMDKNGNLYGTASQGGSSGTDGVVFKLDTTGKETVLYNFAGSPDGSNPQAGLLQDSSNNFYGTTRGGGNLDCVGTTLTGCGTVFKLDSTGKETVLYSFRGGEDGSDGAFPNTTLVLDSAGNLYGTTVAGSPGPCYSVENIPPEKPFEIHCGTVFRLDSTGKETVLHHFSRMNDGVGPNGDLLTDWAGNLYGTTTMGGTGYCDVFGTGPVITPVNVGCGTIYKLDPSGNEIVLFSFGSNDQGIAPDGGLIADAEGNLYGTTNLGGTHNFGTVFKFTAAISGVSISPLTTTLVEGTSQAFTAKVENDPNNLGVTWSIVSACNLGPSCQGTLATATPTSVSYGASASSTAGSHVTIVATSNANPNISTTALVTITPGVNTADFSLTAVSANLSAQPGTSVTDVITVAPQVAPFTSAVQLSCTVAGPSPMPTCALTPTSVTPGSTSATTTLTVTAPAATAALRHPNGRLHAPNLAGLFALPIFALVLVTGRKNRRQRVRAFIGLLLLVAWAAGCGGGTSSPPPPPPPTLNYTVTVTATSGAIQHTAQVIVEVL